MNYITRLQQENAQMQYRMSAGLCALEQFRIFLNSPKFTGTESDGGRKDWISTADVHAQLQAIKDAFYAEMPARAEEQQTALNLD